MFRFLKIFLAPYLLLVFVCLPIQAQTVSATLSGVVEDEKGAVIPGVKVTITNPATGFESSVITNSSGAYAIPLLPPATYTVTAEQTGFTRVQFPDIVLNVNDQRSLRIELKVGSVEAAIEVRADETLIDTSPAVATTIDRTFVGNLPLSGRSFQSLYLLTPGVVLTGGSAALNPGEFSVNGQRANANYFTVDGVSANTGVSTSGVGSTQLAGTVPGTTALGTTQSLVSVDALEEFKIQTSTYAAEFGRQPGGQVQLVTRSGNNEFHGTMFEYLRNEATDANDWFLNRAGIDKPALRQNQFGGTFSGPVFFPRFGEGGPFWYNGKDRTFFFFSYEGLRLLLPSTVNTLVPSIELRAAAASELRPLLNMFPLPTGPEEAPGAARLFVAYSSPSATDATGIRIDHVVNSNLALFGRYSEVSSEDLTRFLAFLSGGKQNVRTITLGTALSLGTKLTNEFRFNHTRHRGRLNFDMDDFGGAVPVDPSVLVTGFSGPGRKFGSFNFNLPNLFISSGLGDNLDSFQRQINVVDNLSWVKGSHQFKFGIDYRRLAPIYGPVEYQQEVSFDQTLIATTSFLTISASQGARPLFDNFSAYAQDTWTVTPNLTLNLGLRWEFNPPPGEADGKKPVFVSGVKENGDVSQATLAAPGTPLYKTFYTAFAPRIGAAYKLRSTSGWETVLRGGFGLYYDLGSGPASAGFAGFPFLVSNTQEGPIPYPISPAMAVPPPFPTATTLPIAANIFAVNADLKLPYTLQWNLSLEQSVGTDQTVSISYVASAARQLLTTKPLNQLGGASGRPNPNFRVISFTSNGPTSDYHSMQVQFRRRLSHGLQALANYTWSHAIDEVSNEAFELGKNLERGNADFDVRHNFSAAITYDIPKLRAGPVLTSVLRDWSLDGTVYVQSGLPLNMRQLGGSRIQDDGTFLFVRPDVIAGEPFWIDDPTAPGGQRLNPAAFQRVTGSVIRQGTLGRNIVRRPGIFQVNMGLRRQFKLTERWMLQVKAEAFNVFNRPMFGGYDVFVGLSPTTFGRAFQMLNRAIGSAGSGTGGINPLYQIGGPRSMQFSVRLSF